VVLIRGSSSVTVVLGHAMNNRVGYHLGLLLSFLAVFMALTISVCLGGF